MPVIAQFHFCPVFDGGGVTRFDVLPLSFHDGERIIEILLYDVFTTGVVFSQKRVQMFLTVRSCAFRKAASEAKISICEKRACCLFGFTLAGQRTMNGMRVPAS